MDEFRGSWSTPVVFQDGERRVLLIALPQKLHAIDPKTGDDVWTCGGLSNNLSYTSPLIAGDIVVIMCGYGGPAMAVKGGGNGDVTQTRRLWYQDQPKPPQRVGSGVVVGGLVYLLNANGEAWCLDAATGEKKWDAAHGRRKLVLDGPRRGRLYVSNKAGTTYVLEANPAECKILAENRLDELIRASPAFSNGQIFIRTRKLVLHRGTKDQFQLTLQKAMKVSHRGTLPPSS